MPRPYDLGIDKPNNLMQLALQGYEQGRAIKQRNSLQDLMGDYYGQQNPQFGDIARNGGDPSKLIEDQRRQVGELAGMLAAAPPEMRPAMYRALHPKLPRELQAPPEWNDSLLPIVQQAAQQWGAGSQSQMPAEVRTALFFKQHPELAAAEAERYKNRPFYDSNTGQLIYPKPPGGGGSGGGMPQGRELPAQLASTAQFMLEQGVPEAKIDAWLSQQTGQPFQAAPAGPTVVQAGPSAGERAYNSASGKAQAEYDAARARAQFDVEQSGAVKESEAYSGERGKVRAEVENKNDKRGRDADRTMELLDQAEALLPEATGGSAIALKDKALGVVGRSTTGAQRNAELKLVSAELVGNVPRFEGPQSNIDVQFYKDAAGDLANENLPVETRLAAARRMRSLKQKYATQRPAQPKPASSKTWVRGPNGQLVLKGG